MKITIVGGGPAGLLLALRLQHLSQEKDGRLFGHHQVVVYEKRPDPRTMTATAQRSYPITLQPQRGLEAVAAIPGLVDALAEQGIWIDTVTVHGNKNAKPQSFTRPLMLTIDRNRIVIALLNHLEKTGGSVQVRFEQSVEDIHVNTKTLVITDEKGKKAKYSYDGLVVADGAKSVVRRILTEKGLLESKECILQDEYKSIYSETKPVNKNKKDSKPPPELAANSMHGWMKGPYRVIVAPNHDGTAMHGVFIFPPGKYPLADCAEDANADEILTELGKISPHMTQYLQPDEATAMHARPISNVMSV